MHERIAHAALQTDVAPMLGAPHRGWISGRGIVHAMTKLSSDLEALGLRRGDAVAVVLPNGPEMALAFLGVSAVSACAPLNPNLTPREFDFYLDDLDARAVVVTSTSNHPVVGVAERRRVPVVRLWVGTQLAHLGEAGEVRVEIDAAIQHEASPRFADDIALVLHTSGTTARPKIVPLSHTNLATSALNIARTLSLTTGDRCGNIMPLFHIHGLMAGLAAPLVAGSSVLCTPGFAAPDVLGWFSDEHVTWTTAVPTMLQSLVEQGRKHPEQLPNPPLRFLRSSSASLPPLVMEDLEDVFRAPVVEAYGMTEAAHQMCSNPLPPRHRVSGSVGCAAGPEVAIMDSNGSRVPENVVGEIVIRGANVITGYDTTDQSINDKAFTNGWFRTGDQGVIDCDGYVTLTGRLKEIINRGGEKIAPREVDEVLLDHPCVRQALCFAVPDLRLGEQIAAIVVAEPNATLQERELREFAALRLAAFKVPRRIIIVEEIPTGPTGKLQRIGLAERLELQELDAVGAPEPPTAPRNAVEQLVADWWIEILRLDTVSVFDHFLDLGGDSLLAAKLLGRARGELGIDLSMIDFFDSPTIAAQSAFIETELVVTDGS